MTTKFIKAEVDVEVDLNEFGEDELAAELEGGGWTCIKNAVMSNHNELLDAFKLGDPQAVEKCKRFLEDVTGRTI